jgi:hypothetical protein
MSDGEGISGIYVDDGNIVWLIDDYGTPRAETQAPMTYTTKPHTEPQENAAQHVSDAAYEAMRKAGCILGRESYEGAHKSSGTMVVTVAEWDAATGSNPVTDLTQLLTEANERTIALAKRCDELGRQVDDLMGELANVRAALSESDSGARAGSDGDSDGGNSRGLGAQALLTLAAPTHRLGKGNE